MRALKRPVPAAAVSSGPAQRMAAGRGEKIISWMPNRAVMGGSTVRNVRGRVDADADVSGVTIKTSANER